VLPVDVIEAKSQDLTRPHTVGRHEQKHGVVSFPDQGAPINSGKDAANVFPSKDLRRARVLAE
jgi:hypothetical protein